MMAKVALSKYRIVEAVFDMITQNIEKAATTLVGLLDTGNERIKRLTANDIIGHFLKLKELRDMEEHLQQIEERLDIK